jgi:hypothetical protein
MNFTEYMNRTIFGKFAHGKIAAIGEQKTSAYDADIYIDLSNADIICDLEKSLPDIRADHVRLGEVLEHLTNDAPLLRHLHGRARTILVTVPFQAPASYHVRLHSDWSIRKLLSVTGWQVREYIPRKAPRLDRLIWMLRIMGQWVNPLFVRLNPWLPIKPNGGYYFCVPCEAESIYRINEEQFARQALGGES